MSRFQLNFEDNVEFMYILMLALALVIGYGLAIFLLIKQKIKLEFVCYSVILNLVMMIFCAKVYTIIANDFRLDYVFVPLSSLGAAIGMLLGTMIFGFILSRERTNLWRAYSLVVPLMYSVAKIGCFFVGCCGGIKYDGFWAVHYHNSQFSKGPCFPIQLLESIVFMLVFVICLMIYLSKHSECLIICVVFLSSLAKFILDFLREEHIGKVLSMNQVVCIGFLIWVIVLLVYKIRKNKINAVE